MRQPVNRFFASARAGRSAPSRPSAIRRYSRPAVAVLAAVTVLSAVAAAQPAMAVGDKPGVPDPAVTVAKLTGQRSINQTDSKWQLYGTDLGILWDNGRGQVLSAFGDTYGKAWGGNGGGPSTDPDWRCNVLGRSSDRNLADGMTFDDMAADKPGYAKQLLDCKKVDRDEHTVIPTAGISVGKRQYLQYMSINRWDPWTTNYSGVAYSDDNGQHWTKDPKARWQNTPASDQKFQMTAYAKQGGYVLMYGTPNGRFGGVHLARVPEHKILDKSAYRYWNGKKWQTSDAAAAQIVPGPAGELSVVYSKYLKKWVMAYLDEKKAAIVLRQSPSPTGPWGEPTTIVQGGPNSQYGGLYAPYFHPWSANSNSPDLYFTMSLWPTYNVYLMKVHLNR